MKDFGRLDVVVPNAGIACHVPAEDFTEEEYRNIMAVNLDGAFFTAQAAAQAFKKQKASGILQQGRIVFTASVSSLIVNHPQKQAPYNASKAGLVRLAKCLAVEWVDVAGVNCVAPGFIPKNGEIPGLHKFQPSVSARHTSSREYMSFWLAMPRRILLAKNLWLEVDIHCVKSN